MRSLPPLSAVRVFEAAARHENFTRAAAELGMTQAAVSYQIKLLEERLGASLFRRHKGRLSLSDIGRRIAPLATDAFDTLDRAFRLARAENEQVLTVTTTESFAAHWFAPRIGRFQVRQPELAVRLQSDPRYVDFNVDDVDVAIRYSADAWHGLACHFLLRPLLQPMASPDFAAEHGTTLSPEAIMRLPRLSPEDNWWRQWLVAMGGTPDAAPGPPGIRLDSETMEGNAAMGGHGVAILNRLFWPNDMRAGRLVPLSDYVPGPGAYWLVYPEYRRSSPKIRAFRNWLESEIALVARDYPAALFTPPD